MKDRTNFVLRNLHIGTKIPPNREKISETRISDSCSIFNAEKDTSFHFSKFAFFLLWISNKDWKTIPSGSSIYLYNHESDCTTFAFIHAYNQHDQKELTELSQNHCIDFPVTFIFFKQISQFWCQICTQRVENTSTMNVS